MATDKNGKTLKAGDHVLVDSDGHAQHGLQGVVTEILEGDNGPIAFVQTSATKRTHAPDLRLIKIEGRS